MEIINVETLRTWLEQKQPATILDVRTTTDRAEWWIPGSVHVDAYAALRAHDPRALSTVDVSDDMPVVAVCVGGVTSLIAAKQLELRGIDAYSLEGGMKAWSLAWNTATIPYAENDVRIIQVRRTGKGCLSYVQVWTSIYTAAYNPEIQQHWPSFVVVPQISSTQNWVDTNVHKGSYVQAKQPTSVLSMTMQLLDALQHQYTGIDANRRYITGISSGAFGV
jgi:rhodanese-related sulfurtransferase